MLMRYQFPFLTTAKRGTLQEIKSTVKETIGWKINTIFLNVDRFRGNTDGKENLTNLKTLTTLQRHSQLYVDRKRPRRATLLAAHKIREDNFPKCYCEAYLRARYNGTATELLIPGHITMDHFQEKDFNLALF